MRLRGKTAFSGTTRGLPSDVQHRLLRACGGLGDPTAPRAAATPATPCRGWRKLIMLGYRLVEKVMVVPTTNLEGAEEGMKVKLMPWQVELAAEVERRKWRVCREGWRR